VKTPTETIKCGVCGAELDPNSGYYDHELRAVVCEFCAVALLYAAEWLRHFNIVGCMRAPR
jgi:ribosomal protein S27E